MSLPRLTVVDLNNPMRRETGYFCSVLCLLFFSLLYASDSRFSCDRSFPFSGLFVVEL